MEITTIVLQILLGLAFFGAGGSKLAGVQSLKADFKRFGLQAVRLPAVVYVPHRNSGIDRRTWDDRWHLLTRMESPGLLLAVVMVGAVLTHVRVKDPARKMMPATVLFLLAVIAIYFLG